MAVSSEIFSTSADADNEDLDLGSDYWNEALRQLRWNCVNYGREDREYTYGLHKLRRAANLDQWIKEAEAAVQEFGTLDMSLTWPPSNLFKIKSLSMWHSGVSGLFSLSPPSMGKSRKSAHVNENMMAPSGMMFPNMAAMGMNPLAMMNPFTLQQQLRMQAQQQQQAMAGVGNQGQSTKDSKGSSSSSEEDEGVKRIHKENKQQRASGLAVCL